jgi:hypothetical protein
MKSVNSRRNNMVMNGDVEMMHEEADMTSFFPVLAQRD